MGPRYGKDMKAVAAYIQAMSQEEIAGLEKDGSLVVVVGEKEFMIQVEDVNISTQDGEGSVVLSLDGLTVALDIVIDEKLKGEGIAREVVNRIQNMRKEADFNVSDRIDVTICAEDEIKCAIDTNNDYICSETLTHSLVFADTISDGESVEFDDVKMIINIKKHD